jgi:hypothetical protein
MGQPVMVVAMPGKKQQFRVPVYGLYNRCGRGAERGIGLQCLNGFESLYLVKSGAADNCKHVNLFLKIGLICLKKKYKSTSCMVTRQWECFQKSERQ